MKILVIEDHPKIRENISKYFKIIGYTIEESYNWEDALLKVSTWNYDILILDVNMPIMNWKEFLKIIRSKWFSIPVLALTSNSTLDDKVEMYDLWVDDYLTKPFELKELEIRVNSLLKRKDKKIDEVFSYRDYKINYSIHKFYFAWNEIILSNKEYLIIEFLLKNKWYPKSKNQILEKVWWELEENLDISSTTLESHISTIRKKTNKDFIKTIKWVWYIIE
mgnify:CR=1 FL=1